MKEMVKVFDESTGYSDDCTTLEIVCDVSAPDEVISFLVQTEHQLHLQVSHMPGEILMDMNQNLDLIKKYLMKGNGPSTNICFVPKKRDHITSKPSTACIIMIPT